MLTTQQNYAGDLSLPAASHVIRTIFSIFPICRIFRESPPAAGSSTVTSATKDTPDFTNMLIFCKHPSSSPGLTFRQPVPSDFLESGARQQYLFPRPELEISKEVFDLDGGPVLKSGQTRQLEMWHRRSAVGHWRIMRTVLPDVVWENW